MARKQKATERAKDRRDALLKPKWRKADPLSAKQREVILALLIEGATLSEIFTIRGVASYGAFYATRTDDAEFDDAVRKALAHGAEAAIAEANEVTRQAVASMNPDDMRIAESFHRCALTYAEKAAPREFGPLVKIGGPDGGALIVQTVSFATKAISLSSDALSSDNVGKDQRKLADTRARDLEGEFAELDP